MEHYLNIWIWPLFALFYDLKKVPEILTFLLELNEEFPVGI